MKYTTEQRKKILCEYKKGTKVKREFCKENGISIGSLNRWLKAEKPKFVKVENAIEDKTINANKHEIAIFFKEIKVVLTCETQVETVLKAVINLC